MTLTDELRAQEHAWHERPLVRVLYREWFEAVVRELSDVPGGTIELGAGIARFREVCPGAVATDVEPTPWAEAVVDAASLPYETGSVANLVLIDVFHHLPRPVAFLDEARRVLATGGRVVVLDPYCSPLSTLAYRRFHRERTDPSAPAFEEDEAVAAAPMASNQARATLVFFRERAEFERRWPELAITTRRRLALLVYPLSGGFSGRRLVPHRVGRALRPLERALSPLTPLMAFRCLVTLERRA